MDTSGPPTLDDLLHFEERALRCPHLVFDRYRDEQPVAWLDETGVFMVTRYEDVNAVVRNPELFSSRAPTGPHAAGALRDKMMALAAEDDEIADLLQKAQRLNRSPVLLGADPPDHQRQRLLVNQAFTPRRVRQLEDDIRKLAHELIDDFAPRGEVELVEEFGVLLPLTVIARALGVADHELRTFKEWSDDLVIPVGNHDPSTEQIGDYIRSNAQFNEYFAAKLAERRDDPRDDLITDVVQARLDGDELTEPEMLAMLQQFLVAGNETTTKMICSMMLRLVTDPALMATVAADPAGHASGMVEETLRLEAPVQGLYRQANADTRLGDVEIPAGSHLWCVYAAGNRDGDQFAEPEQLDPGRKNTRTHLAFGQGPHYCIGANLARAEGRIALETLLGRLDGWGLAAPADSLRYEESYVLRGLKELPLTFTPAP